MKYTHVIVGAPVEIAQPIPGVNPDVKGIGDGMAVMTSPMHAALTALPEAAIGNVGPGGMLVVGGRRCAVLRIDMCTEGFQVRIARLVAKYS